ncbi:phosphoribosylamine--glycine ligase [Candidatus Micrarchaeota archaeon]|nr:phosphoribosylamine--glycine ligase [Candidatus Micrarchaeota archaeon]
MRILLVGSGAREHAIAKAICKHEGAELYSYMSSNNPGMRKLSKEYVLGNIVKDNEVVSWAVSKKIELAVIGPEAPLSAGVSDALWRQGIKCVGPVKEAAKLEWDKGYTRYLMKKYSIPGCPRFEIFRDVRDAQDFIEELKEVAIKPAGLTGGKGVKVTGFQLKGLEEAKDYAREVLEQNIGTLKAVVIEERLVGEEFTLQCFVDGKSLVPAPCVQDFKRAYEGDEGKNTGGMGSYNDRTTLLPFMRKEDYDNALEIMKKTVDSFRKDTGLEYKGFLYGQFMATRDGVKLIEYNSRLGDPEAINMLAILKSDFVDMLYSICDGKIRNVQFQNKATVCKYVVPKEYPDNPKAGDLIEINEDRIAKNNTEIYYASVEEREGRVYTGSSRSLALLSVADSIDEAEHNVENSTRYIHGEIRHRRDIATKEVIDKKVEFMDRLRE